MLKHRIVRTAIAGSAAVVPVAGIVAVGSGPAGAAPSGITCTKLSGTANLTTNSYAAKLSGCSGHTGGSGKIKGMPSPLPTSVKAKWLNHTSTTFTTTFGTTSSCAANDLTVNLDDVVTDNTNSSTTIGAAVSATVCYNLNSGALSLLPGTNFVFAP